VIFIKKVAILTFHHTTNYGAVLQTYALQTTVEKLGNECKIIDYRCPLIECNFKKLHFYNFRNPYNYIKYRMNINNYLQKFNIFNNFINENIKTTDKIYYDKKGLKDLDVMFDKFICGSDQIWNYNITGNDTTYFLDFISVNQKKIAYAASFGLDKIEDKNTNLYKRCLSNIQYISLREKTGIEIVEQLTSKIANMVLDPTLLITKNEWINFSNHVVVGDFILVYELETSDDMLEYAIHLSHEYNCKVFVIVTRRVNCQNIGNVNFVINCSPKEFISYFHSAKYIITNSFHGTAFSINFNKDFTTYLLKHSHNVNTRLINLLELFGLQNRLYKGTSISSNINYDSVNENLNEYRAYSIKFLDGAINDDVFDERSKSE